MQVRIRAVFDVVDTTGPTGNPVDYFYLLDPDGGTALTGHLGGPHVGQLWTSWVTPSAGRVQVPFLSGVNAKAYTGVALAGYEYQRFQTGAQPFWTPLGFPGQYRDPETDLFQNWNRFYDSSIGRYLSAEPAYNHPDYSVDAARNTGHSIPAYSYALNDPIDDADPTGLDVFKFGGGDVHQFLGFDYYCTNTCEPDPWLLTLSFGCSDKLDWKCYLGNGPAYTEIGRVKLSDVKGVNVQRCEADCETTQRALDGALERCNLGYNVFWNNCQEIVTTAMTIAGCK
jgi:RHS repeat-associated protein